VGILLLPFVLRLTLATTVHVDVPVLFAKMVLLVIVPAVDMLCSETPEGSAESM